MLDSQKKVNSLLICSLTLGGPHPLNQRWVKNVQSGYSIGRGKRGSGTAGIFQRKSDGSIYGLTAGNLFSNNAIGRSVQQPSLKDFNTYHRKLFDLRYQIQDRIKKLTDDLTREINKADLAALSDLIDPITPLAGADENETCKNIKVGEITMRELSVVNYNNRQCVSEFAIFRVNEERRAVDRGWIPPNAPVGGELGKVNWHSMTDKFSELEFDQKVRKNGRTTGTTYGIVGGL